MIKHLKLFTVLIFGLGLMTACRKDPEVPTPEYTYIQEGQNNWTKHEFMKFSDFDGCGGCDPGNRVHFNNMYFAGDIGYISGDKDIHETQGMIFKTLDGGLTWSPIYPSLCGAGSSEKVCFFINPTHGFVTYRCFFNTAIRGTWDGGLTWSTSGNTTEPENYLNGIRKYEIIGPGQYIVQNMKTTDWAYTWTPMNLIDSTSCFDFTDSQYGVCATESGVIAETNDSGATWVTLYDNPAYSFLCISIPEPGVIIAGGNKIMRSTNGGNSWNEVYSSGLIRDIKFVDENIGFAATNTGGSYNSQYFGDILKTTDGGLTWTVNYHSDFMSFNCIFIENDQTIYATGNKTDNDTIATGVYYIKTTTQGN